LINQRKLKVLIVDDSIVFRQMLAKRLSEDKGIEVVATASNPYEARDKILQYHPHVMTLDVEMPRMNGIEFLKKLMPQYPIPTVVVSSVSENVFNALNTGAVDFVSKPQGVDPKAREQFINELILKIKIASTAKILNKNASLESGAVITSQTRQKRDIKMIAIGASTGGTEALYNILTKLPPTMPGIVIVQHMPPVFTKMYAERLNSACLLEVKEAETGDIVLPGKAFIAPGGLHMKIKKAGTQFVIECFKGEKVNGHCPSVDVLFHSVADHLGDQALGIILTGMGYDGAKGLLAMKKKGSMTLGQDEKSCVVYGMPKVAFNIGAVEKQIPLNNMAEAIYKLVTP